MSLRRSVFLLASALLLVFAAAGNVEPAEYESVDNVAEFEKQEWSDLPNYVEDLDAEIVYSDTIQVRESGERCGEYVNKTYDNGTDYTECDSMETYFYGGKSTYLFDLKNIETEYLGGGEIYLSFVASPSELVKNLHLTDKNPNWEKSDYVEWFNERYLYNGQNFTVEEFDRFRSLAEDVAVSSLERSVEGRRVESSNLMSGSGRYEFVVQLKDFRSGGVALNDAVGVRLKSDAYNGRGETL